MHCKILADIVVLIHFVWILFLFFCTSGLRGYDLCNSLGRTPSGVMERNEY
jgi:hypothetical protein